MKFFTFLILFSTFANAEDAYQKFDVTHNITNSSHISWRQVNNVQNECENESHKRGLGGFGYPIDACSFWTAEITGPSCVIITAKKTNLETLGHEIRHCFQGAYHK